MRLTMLAFMGIAAFDVYVTLAPRIGVSAAFSFAVVAFAALWLAACAHERRQPVALGLDPEGIVAYDAAGDVLVRGPIASCAQWANRVIVIAVKPDGGRRVVPLVVAADALDAESFRVLAVRARHAAHRYL